MSWGCHRWVFCAVSCETKVFNILPILKYKMPSCFYGEKWVDYGICKVSVCPQTPPKGILRQHFHYDDSSMYVCDCGWYKLCIAESVVLGKVSISKNVGLKISYLMIVQYANDDVYDMQLATQWRFHCSTVSLTCFTVTLWTWSKFYTYVRIIQHCHALHIHVLTVEKSTFVAVLLWKHYHWSAGAEKHAEGGVLC